MAKKEFCWLDNYNQSYEHFCLAKSDRKMQKGAGIKILALEYTSIYVKPYKIKQDTRSCFKQSCISVSDDEWLRQKSELWLRVKS